VCCSPWPARVGVLFGLAVYAAGRRLCGLQASPVLLAASRWEHSSSPCCHRTFRPGNQRDPSCATSSRARSSIADAACGCVGRASGADRRRSVAVQVQLVAVSVGWVTGWPHRTASQCIFVQKKIKLTKTKNPTTHKTKTNKKTKDSSTYYFGSITFVFFIKWFIKNFFIYKNTILYNYNLDHCEQKKT
jgi:hypothetical protein